MKKFAWTLVIAALAAFTSTFAFATGTPPPETPPDYPKATANQTQAASAMAGAAAAAKSAAESNASASSTSAGGAASVGAVSPSLTGSVSSSTEGSRAWSLFAQPPAFTPPMAPIVGCAPVITQEAISGWLIVGGLSKASGKTDPTDCTLIALRNAKVEQCQYASAKQIEDLLTAKLLPGYKPNEVKFEDLTPGQCAAVHAKPAAAPAAQVPAPVVNYVTTPPAQVVVQQPAAPVACVAPAPAPKKPAAKKVAASNACEKK